jgi:Lrp/AsnC family leucine-responsive transcriptional regulator
MELDSADRRILRAVQENCTLGAEALGELCGMSPSTALRRLKKLRSAGIVAREIAVLDAKKVGRPLLMIVGVRLERDDARVAAEFVREMRDCPAVMQCFFVTGSADYILHISAADMEEFDAFIQARLVSNPCVSMSETHVVIHRVKTGLTLPVPE